MSLLRSCQRLQVFSTQWKIVLRLKSTRKNGNGETNYEDTYWFPQSGGVLKDFEDIPGPRFLPIIGHDWRYHPIFGMYDRDKIHHTFAKLFKQYGYVVKENIGKKRVIVHLFHPDDFRLVYKSDGSYPTRMSHTIVAKYRMERPHLYDSPGLGPSNGEEWRSFRLQFVNRESGSFLRKDNYPQMEQATDDLLSRVQSRMDKDGEADVMPLLFRWTLEATGIATLKRRLGFLDEPPNPDTDKLIEAAHIFNDVVYRTETMPHGHAEQYERLVPAEDYFASVVRKHVAQAIEDLPNQENPFLESILTEDVKMNDLHTFFLDLFHAGIHTTAVSTAFALYHLALNEKPQKILRSRLMDDLPSKDTRYVDSKAERDQYLGWVVNESLRLNPPTIGNGRVLQVPLVLGGYRIPESTMVLLHHQVASLQEENYIDALSFRPERYDSKSPYFTQIHYASQPFGFITRMCVGFALANKEMKLAIAKFVRNFEISYHHEKIDTVNRLHNEPDKPVKLRFTPVSR